ncbi:tetratricopeptide repeat protein [Patiriisocius hiemis]|uniref:Tetratricopeptide repeat protein n=1 Tax=Patiriisocius hiemis TaxID=3075604 RepID=A0ABU2YAW1_9FLAO|nr:tetratricopeptide repeat protein [Constantimarinum sp. W242]MDT0554774.1 tetratricopeptide repeat protein [Constantimarinum sp. W242]
MKKQILVVGISLITTISFGQKKEIKKAQKAVKSGDYTEAISLLDTAEGLLGSADNDLKTDFYVAKGEAYSASAGTSNFDKMKKAADAFLMAIEIDPTIERDISESIQKLRVNLINSAIDDQNANDHINSSKKLYTSYTISKKDTSDLYFAASSAVNGNDYDTALEYYNKLLDLGYTGIAKQFVATDKSTGEVTPFPSKNERDLMVKSGEFIKPETKIAESKRGEILRNMTLIYFEQGNQEEATKLLSKARKENPNDMSLVKAEANLAYQLGDKEKYNKLMNEIVKSDPNNPEVYFGLGVSSADIGQNEKAIEYYQKAIELKPDYAEALINLAVIKLSSEKDIVEEMNGLGTSRADDARYEELKQKRQDLYTEVLPTLEKAYQYLPGNIEIMKTLMNLYSQLGQDNKYKEMKALVEEKEG